MGTMANQKLMVVDTYTLRKLLCTLMELHNPKYVICVKDALGMDFADMDLVDEMLTSYLGISSVMEQRFGDKVIEKLCRVLLKQHGIIIDDMYCHSNFNPELSQSYYTCYLQLNNQNVNLFNELLMQLEVVHNLKNFSGIPFKECTLKDFAVLKYSDLIDFFKEKLNSIVNSQEIQIGLCSWSEYNMYKGQLDITFKSQKDLEHILTLVRKLAGTNLKTQDFNIDLGEVYPRVLVPLSYFEPLVRNLMGIPNETNLICCTQGFMSCLSEETNQIELLATKEMTITCMKLLEVMPYDTCKSKDYTLIPVSA